MELDNERTLYKALPISLRSNHGLMELQCLEGQIWLTIAGYGEDFILSQGQKMFLSEANGPVVLESLVKQSRLQLRQHQPAA